MTLFISFGNGLLYELSQFRRFISVIVKEGELTLDDIDFVVTWVNSEDQKWQKKKEKFASDSLRVRSMNTQSRYRNYRLFKYWFRAVEKYAPWVHKIFLITDNQVPTWLDVENEKIVLVNHSDYIDSKYLPTFNSNVIELEIGLIPNLADHFVLFNDDTFLNAQVTQEDFFKGSLPRDTYVESPIISTKGSIAHAMVNDMEVINDVFSKKQFYRKNWNKVFSARVGLKLLRTLVLLPSRNFSGIWNSHLPVPYLTKTFYDVWHYMPDALENMMNNKFRTPYDYNHWLMRYWQLVSGNFQVQSSNWGRVYDLGMTRMECLQNEIEMSKHKVICLNDTDNVVDPTIIRDGLTKSFEKIFPQKSVFEK